MGLFRPPRPELSGQRCSILAFPRRFWHRWLMAPCSTVHQTGQLAHHVFHHRNLASRCYLLRSEHQSRFSFSVRCISLANPKQFDEDKNFWTWTRLTCILVRWLIKLKRINTRGRVFVIKSMMGELLCSMCTDHGAFFAIWAGGGAEMPRANGARAAHNERSRARRELPLHSYSASMSSSSSPQPPPKIDPLSCLVPSSSFSGMRQICVLKEVLRE